jgi:hypothetical protein
VVGELGDGGERRGLGAAALGAHRHKHARRLAHQGAGLPQAARGVEEGLHLGGHHAEAGGGGGRGRRQGKEEGWANRKEAEQGERGGSDAWDSSAGAVAVHVLPRQRSGEEL